MTALSVNLSKMYDHQCHTLNYADVEEHFLLRHLEEEKQLWL